MMFFHSKVLTLVTILWVLPLRVVISQDTDSLLYAVSEMYKDLKDFHFEGTTSLRVRKGWQTQTSEYFVRVAQEFPHRYRVEIGGERGRLLVSSDTVTIAYHPVSKEYIERPEPLETASQRRDFPDVIKMYARLYEISDTITMLDPDTLYSVNGMLRKAYYIEIIPKVTPQTHGHSINYQFMIDHETLAVLKERKATYIPDTPQGALSMTQTTSYEVVNVTSQIPDSLFDFTPPNDASRVKKIDAFPNIPTSLYGQTASSFSLPIFGSDQVLSLDDLAGNVVLLNFWATWCGPCRAEMGALNTLHHLWKESGLEILAINVEETPQSVSIYQEEEAHDFTILLDKFGVTSRQMDVYELPTSFIIDRSGVIRHHLIGAREQDDFVRYLSPFFEKSQAGN